MYVGDMITTPLIALELEDIMAGSDDPLGCQSENCCKTSNAHEFKGVTSPMAMIVLAGF